MKIALLGYGKMGRAIEQLALAAGDEIVLRVDDANRAAIGAEQLRVADVAIEFSRPDAAVANINLALDAGVPIVVGTTGWLAELPAVSERVTATGGALFHASNFSIGVNVFFAAAQQLGKLLGRYGGYDAAVEEIHHLHKLESPSGTAITLAERFGEEGGDYDSWVLDRVSSPVPQQHIAPRLNAGLDGCQPAAAATAGKRAVPIHSIRREGVPGTHTLTLSSEIDTIEITHTAHSRLGFAQGALAAARWVIGKQGVFTMEDLVEI